MPQTTSEILCAAEHHDEQLEGYIQARIPTEDEAVDAAEIFRQLSDSTRVRILSILSIQPLCVCEMADILGMSQPAVSHHLRSLRQCGVIKFKKSGKRAVYSLSENKIGNMVGHVLGDICGREGEQQ